jgi:hypothetical protein
LSPLRLQSAPGTLQQITESVSKKDVLYTTLIASCGLQRAGPNLNRDRRPSLFEIPLAHDATSHTILHEFDQAQRPLESSPGGELSQYVS